ncbi:lysozyme inhibitor LprI family protein [Methylomonas sp. 2BW1-5-20]|uniref:lysozyme inhibitor LprI family protein n=1 Tax=Methylomonas sp. 2BW1-5-20 TaxID=3376686 RepID=UPI00404CBB88
MLGESIDLENDFIGSLENFENGQVPSFTSQQFSNADTKLNAIYKRIQTETKDASWGTITNNGIMKTQREWLKYRDAWVKFGSIKYPAVSATSWKTYLTEKRIKMLEDFLP